MAIIFPKSEKKFPNFPSVSKSAILLLSRDFRFLNITLFSLLITKYWHVYSVQAEETLTTSTCHVQFFIKKLF